MLLLFFGPSCSGKSTIAKIIADKTDVTIWIGKDYLRLDKNEDSAWEIFISKLEEASKEKELSSKSIIYVINDITISKSDFFRNKEIIKVKFIASIKILKKRFSNRIKGKLPPSIANMLEMQLQKTQSAKANLEFDTTQIKADVIAEEIISYCKNTFLF